MKRITTIAVCCLLLASCGRPSVLFSYNVRNCCGMDYSTDIARTASVIRGADFAALQELDSVTGRSKGKYVLGELASLTGMHATYAPAIDYDGGKYGIGLLSAEKPLGFRTVPLPGREERRILLIAEFEDFYICTAHFSLNAEDRLSSAAIVRDVINRLDKPSVFCGDLNAEPDSPEIELLRECMEMISTGEKSWPADSPTEAIDYVFGREICPIGAEVVDEPAASDHRPIKVTFK